MSVQSWGGVALGGGGKPLRSYGRETERALEDLGLDGRMILELILKKSNWMAWTGLIWLRTGESGGLFVYHKMGRIS
jgi:hypothetical protein